MCRANATSSIGAIVMGRRSRAGVRFRSPGVSVGVGVDSDAGKDRSTIPSRLLLLKRRRCFRHRFRFVVDDSGGHGSEICTTGPPDCARNRKGSTFALKQQGGNDGLAEYMIVLPGGWTVLHDGTASTSTKPRKRL
jgi:hypothetical protein